MFETIEIAFLGTFIAIVLSIPLGLFSARNLAPNYFVYLICKTIVIFFRAIPEFIIAMILVIAIGFGAMPGVLALGLHTMGFLAKFYAEDIEHINKGPIDALKSSGANKGVAVVPSIYDIVSANSAYVLDEEDWNPSSTDVRKNEALVDNWRIYAYVVQSDKAERYVQNLIRGGLIDPSRVVSATEFGERIKKFER